jgi:fructokinase
MNNLELPLVVEMFAMTKASPAEWMLSMQQKFGVKLVLVTCGEHGALASDGTRVVEHSGFSVQVRDTIGAGDAFSAAATHCLLTGASLDDILAFANRWASWVASQAGGMPALDQAQRNEMDAKNLTS